MLIIINIFIVISCQLVQVMAGSLEQGRFASFLSDTSTFYISNLIYKQLNSISIDAEKSHKIPFLKVISLVIKGTVFMYGSIKSIHISDNKPKSVVSSD